MFLIEVLFCRKGWILLIFDIFWLKLIVFYLFEEIRECGDDMIVIVLNFGNGGCRF